MSRLIVLGAGGSLDRQAEAIFELVNQLNRGAVLIIAPPPQ